MQKSWILARGARVKVQLSHYSVICPVKEMLVPRQRLEETTTERGSRQY